MSTDNFIDQLANKISQLGLASPAIALLEAHKPLGFIGSQLMLMAQPTLQIFLPPQTVQNTTALLANSDQLEQLIVRLEQKTGQPASLKEPGQ